jgi:hypothetical protein
MLILKPVICSFHIVFSVEVIEGVRISVKERLVVLSMKGLKLKKRRR